MKKWLVSILGIGLNFVMIPTAIAAYNPTLPTVVECQTSTTDIPGTGGQLDVTLHIVDPTPVNFVVVNVMDKSAHSIAAGVLQLSSGAATDGMWSKTLTIAQDLRPGFYNVVAQTVSDTSNNAINFYFCPNLTINYGNAPATPLPIHTQVLTPTPKASTAATVTPIPAVTPTNAANPDAVSTLSGKYNQLLSQLSLVQNQLTALNNKISKICAAKPKPKGC